MITYPTAEDYIRVVQTPDAAFTAPRLRVARFAVDPILQIPMPASGNRAVVFRAEVGGEDRALRFYTLEEDPQTRRRYTELGRVLTGPKLLPCVATATWIDEAVTIRQRHWPMVEMQWVEGRTLDTYVNYLAEDRHTGALGALADEWRGLITSLQSVRFAHGDLQHGNVLIDTKSKLRLVDFDGSWIESFRGMPAPAEIGHPNYQRAGREWGRWMDTFPGLVVYTALLGLAHNPGSWSTDWTQDKILFVRDDFLPPFRTPTWERLAWISDPQITRAVAALKHCCEPNWTATGSLEDLLADKIEIPRPRPSAPSGRADTPWWELTGAVAHGPSPRKAMPPPPPAPRPEKPPSTPPSPRPGTTPRHPARPSGAGTTPRRNWHQQTPAPDPQLPNTPPLPAGPSWTAQILQSVVYGVVFGLLAMVVANTAGVDQAVQVVGATAGLVFAVLMLVILRRRS